jgi:hypothetical protein
VDIEGNSDDEYHASQTLTPETLKKPAPTKKFLEDKAKKKKENTKKKKEEEKVKKKKEDEARRKRK